MVYVPVPYDPVEIDVDAELRADGGYSSDVVVVYDKGEGVETTMVGGVADAPKVVDEREIV